MTSPFPVSAPQRPEDEDDDACVEDATRQDGVAVTSAWSNRFREASRTRLVTSRRHVTGRDVTRRRWCCCWRPRRTLRHDYVIEHEVVFRVSLRMCCYAFLILIVIVLEEALAGAISIYQRCHLICDVMDQQAAPVGYTHLGYQHRTRHCDVSIVVFGVHEHRSIILCS